MYPTRRVALAALLAASIALIVPPNCVSASFHNAPKALVTFAFFGCNRIDGKDWQKLKKQNPSSANVPQLRQNLTDIAALAPDLLFFGGDLVMGYGDDDGKEMAGQFSSWIDLVKSLPHSPGTRYIAITGNHELNRKRGDDKLPNPHCDEVWTSLVTGAGLIPEAAASPAAERYPGDRLIDDQHALSFSFNQGSVHFVVLNTDTRVSTIDRQTGMTKIAMVPVHWLNEDLDSAEKSPAIRAVIVMGHRNLIDPESVKGDAPIDSECAVPMIKSLKLHKKVRAYICAHVHAFDISTIGKSGLRQVCFGNGGSLLEKSWKPQRGRTYGFGLFKVYDDGSLGVTPYLRPEPAEYMTDDPGKVPPASAEAEVIIKAR